MNFDDYLKNSFEKEPFEFNEEYWIHAQDLLNKERRRRRNRRLVFWGSIFLIVLSIIGIVLHRIYKKTEGNPIEIKSTLEPTSIISSSLNSSSSEVEVASSAKSIEKTLPALSETSAEEGENWAANQLSSSEALSSQEFSSEEFSSEEFSSEEGSAKESSSDDPSADELSTSEPIRVASSAKSIENTLPALSETSAEEGENWAANQLSSSEALSKEEESYIENSGSNSPWRFLSELYSEFEDSKADFIDESLETTVTNKENVFSLLPLLSFSPILSNKEVSFESPTTVGRIPTIRGRWYLGLEVMNLPALSQVEGTFNEMGISFNRWIPIKGRVFLETGIVFRGRTGDFLASVTTLQTSFDFGYMEDRFTLRPQIFYTANCPITIGVFKDKYQFSAGILLSGLMGAWGVNELQTYNAQEPDATGNREIIGKGWLDTGGLRKLNLSYLVGYKIQLLPSVQFGLFAEFRNRDWITQGYGRELSPNNMEGQSPDPSALSVYRNISLGASVRYSFPLKRRL
jgi:hypothetical protein